VSGPPSNSGHDADCWGVAEFRGPGVRHQFDESPDDYDMDVDSRSRAFSVRSGRIILLGDGTEVLTDQMGEDLFEADEDKDIETQVRTSSAQSTKDWVRHQREGTPGPQLTHQDNSQTSETPQSEHNVSASPSSITTDSSTGKPTAPQETNEEKSKS
jgi:protein phosphatase PTC2/3